MTLWHSIGGWKCLSLEYIQQLKILQIYFKLILSWLSKYRWYLTFIMMVISAVYGMNEILCSDGNISDSLWIISTNFWKITKIFQVNINRIITRFNINQDCRKCSLWNEEDIMHSVIIYRRKIQTAECMLKIFQVNFNRIINSI